MSTHPCITHTNKTFNIKTLPRENKVINKSLAIQAVKILQLKNQKLSKNFPVTRIILEQMIEL